MMAPPSLADQRIALSFCELLNQNFVIQQRDLCAYHEMATRLPGLMNFQPEPDAVVVPGVSGYELYAERFLLVAEVLSPTNSRTEIGVKLLRYRESADNLYAIVIELRSFLVEVHARRRNWEPLVLDHAANALELSEFRFRCSVGDLYRGTPLDRQGAQGAMPAATATRSA